MKNSINKLRASSLILSAIQRELGDAYASFHESCDNCENISDVVISNFEKRGYREQTVIGMRLGFNPHEDYIPNPVEKFEKLAYTFELSRPESASKHYRRTLRRLADSIVESVA